MENKEIRCIASDVEIRAYEGDKESKGNRMTGYAVKFNDVTTIGNQFQERVMPTAFNGVDMTNTLALWNHNYDEPVGRAGKNLHLSVDDEGLRFDIDLPNTTKGNDIAELVRTGIVGGCSFGFTIADQDIDFQRDGMPLNTINQVGSLYEITFTAIPAYPTTEVTMRSIEAAMEAETVVEPVTAEAVADEATDATPVTEEVVAEAESVEVTEEAPSAETPAESPTLSTTKAEMTEYLLSLLK